MKRSIPLRPHDLRLLWRQPYHRQFCNSSLLQRSSSQRVKVYAIPRRRSRWTLVPSIILFAAFYSTYISEWSFADDEDEDPKKEDEKNPSDDEKSKKNERRIKKKLRLVRKQPDTGKTAEVETQITSLAGTDEVSELGDENFPRINLSTPTSTEPLTVILPPIWQEKPERIFASDEEFKLMQAYSQDKAQAQKATAELSAALASALSHSSWAGILGENAKILNISNLTDFPIMKPAKNKAYCLQISDNEIAFGETELTQENVLYMSRHLAPGNIVRSIFRTIRFYYELKMIQLRIRFDINDPDIGSQELFIRGLMGTKGVMSAADIQGDIEVTPKQAAQVDFLWRSTKGKFPQYLKQNPSIRTEDDLPIKPDASQQSAPWWASMIAWIAPKPGKQKTDLQATMSYCLQQLRPDPDPDPSLLRFKTGNIVFTGLCTVACNDKAVTVDYIAAYDIQSQKIWSCRLSLRRQSAKNTPYATSPEAHKERVQRTRKTIYEMNKPNWKPPPSKDVSGGTPSPKQQSNEDAAKNESSPASSGSESSQQDKKSTEDEEARKQRAGRVSKASSDYKLNRKLGWVKDEPTGGDEAKTNSGPVIDKSKENGAKGGQGGSAEGKKSSSDDTSNTKK